MGEFIGFVLVFLIFTTLGLLVLLGFYKVLNAVNKERMRGKSQKLRHLKQVNNYKIENKDILNSDPDDDLL